MKHKKFYVIGIAGVAMASLAGLLKQKGHKVAGSDQETYEPMKGLLIKEKIDVFSPYRASNIKKWKPDVVVVGNAISRGNPELEWVLSNGLIYRSVSDILKEEFIEGKKSIVVAGTHGKTTTTALIAWIFEKSGLDPTIFVGGFMRNMNSGFKYGKGNYTILEGDEYDTSFFDKNPKILNYRPFFALLNNIELDHIDIYKNLEHVKQAFKNFIKLVPKNGVLAVNKEDKNAWSLVQSSLKSKLLWKNKSEPKIISFGIHNGVFRVKNVSHETKSTSFDLFLMKHKIMRIKTSLMGNHNISNILGAVVIAKSAGISNKKISNAIESFVGVKRRMEILGEKNGVMVIDDYAHHPTAMGKTINSIRRRFHMKRIRVLFEPGSASSRRRVFENEYVKSLLAADEAIIYKTFHEKQINKRERFSINSVKRETNRRGGSAKSYKNIKKLLSYVHESSKPGDIILIMSCRGFDGIREQIFDYL